MPKRRSRIFSRDKLQGVNVCQNFFFFSQYGLRDLGKKPDQRLLQKEWYFVTKIVLTYCEKKIVLVIEKNLKFEAEGREFAKILRSLEQFIQTVKGQNNFWNRMPF